MPWGSSAPFGVVVFTPVRPGGRWVHSGCLDSRGNALCVVGVCWFHAGAPSRLSGSFRVAGFTRVRSGCRQVHSGSLGSRRCALVVVRFIQGHWVHSCALWGSWGPFGVVVFIRVRPGGPRVTYVTLGLLDTPWWSLG